MSNIIKSHQELGQQLKLFFFDEKSAGSAFFLPHGTILYNKLLNYIRNEYEKRDYKEVITPNIFDKSLWIQSGHWDKYKENMYCIEIDKDENDACCSDRQFSLKPMNCPSHCVMFKQMNLSYRQLPLRLADFGVLHRNEVHGSLKGLTRVRKFSQDDSHIFCTEEQIKTEILNVVEFIQKVYKDFNMKIQVGLSTRPEKYIGELSVWNNAENILKEIITEFDDYKINEGDGAFYGPKLDFTVFDSFNRPFQLATIQLDFNLPNRFDLTYQNSEGQHVRPIIIHRAILGSIERFIGILLETTQGKLPFFVNPRQFAIIPVKHNDKNIDDYCKEILSVLKNKNYIVDYIVDYFDDTDTMQKKICNADMLHYSYVIVIGDKEVNSKTVNIRTHGTHVLDDFLLKL